MTSKPKVIHFLWFLAVRNKYIIACGKRDVHDELLSTYDHVYVTCTRCRNTQRFKEPTMPTKPKRPRHRYLFVVLDAAQRTANSFCELGEVIATSDERAVGLVKRSYLGDMISRADFDDQMIIEVKLADKPSAETP
jgi:hypothetical protein